MAKRKRKIDAARIGQVLTHAIHMAEELFDDVPKSGAEKKAWVVDFANEHIDMPWINERQEERVLSVLVDVLVSMVFLAL